MISKNSFSEVVVTTLKYFSNELVTCISVVALIVCVAILTNNKITWDFVVIILLSSIAVYFFDFFDDKTDYDFDAEERKVVRKERNWYWAAVVVIIAFIVLFAWNYGNKNGAIFLFALLLLDLMYPLYFKKMTKKIIGFKDFFVAIMWNLTVILYLVYYSIPVDLPIIFLLLIIFSRDFMGALFCDIRDVEIDKSHNLKTFAVMLGIKKLYLVLYSLNLFSLIAISFVVFSGYFPLFMIFLIIPVITTTALITYGRKTNNFSELLIDNEYYIWVVILLIGRYYAYF